MENILKHKFGTIKFLGLAIKCIQKSGTEGAETTISCPGEKQKCYKMIRNGKSFIQKK